MTKQDLVNEVATVGITKEEATVAVDTVIDAIKGALAKGDKVSLVGFGSFSVKKREAKMGRDPRTEKPLRVVAKKVPVFRTGKSLKNALKN